MAPTMVTRPIPPTQPVGPLPPIARLSETAIDNIKGYLYRYTTRSTDPNDTSDPLPGVIFTLVDRLGTSIICHGAGPRDITIPDVPVDGDTVVFLGSLTKLVTALACLIAVENGLIGLDDWEALYAVVPEIPAKKILTGFDEDYEPVFRDVPETAPKITLRMLLSHVSGFGTTVFSEDLWDFHERDIWQDDIWGGWEWLEQTPMINDPGSIWQYSVGFDYAGKAIERLSGMKFGEFCDKYIFRPLDLHDTSFEPNESMCSRMMCLHHRIEDGVVIRSPAIDFSRICPAKSSNGHHCAGTGLFSTAKDWGVICSVILNQGYCHATGNRIIKPETLEILLTPQLEEKLLPLPTLVSARPEFCYTLPDLDPGDPKKNFGLGLIIVGEEEGCLLPDGSRGKPKGTGWWVGATSVMYWIDRVNGVTGFISSTLMPFPDQKLMELMFLLEREVYNDFRNQKVVGAPTPTPYAEAALLKEAEARKEDEKATNGKVAANGNSVYKNGSAANGTGAH